MTRAGWVCWLVLMAGCSRCGAGAAGVVDAGPKLVGDGGLGNRLPDAKAIIDFRTAIIWLYPEYRDTALLQADATLTRRWETLDDATRDRWLELLHYTPAEDGGWAFSTFHLSQPDAQRLAVTVSYDTDHLALLYVQPTALTTQQLAQYLPRHAVPTGERFTFDVRYVSSPERSAELVQQAVRLLLSSPVWSARAGVDAGVVTDQSVLLEGPDGALLRFERTGGRVFAQYALDTR